jgi:hypothetical protein
MADDSAKGGRRRISGNELLGGAAALATVIAAVVGMLSQFGYIGSHEGGRAAEVSESASEPIASEPKLTSLTGAWRDAGLGGCHLITQSGSKLEVTNYFPGSDTVMSHGEGSVDGGHIQLQLQTMHGDYHVSPDGRVLNGTMYRSHGPGPSRWNYVGSSCQKSG